MFSFLFIPILVFGQVWETNFGGSSGDYGYSVQQTSDGGYIMTGHTESFGNGDDVYLIKADANGVQQWSQTFGGWDYDDGYSVKQTSDGGFIVVGVTYSFGNGDGDVYLIKTDVNGVQQWYRTFGGSDYDYGNSVQQTSDGGYIITGHTYIGDTLGAIYLIKTNSSGVQQWYKSLGGVDDDEGYCVQQTSDGGYIISGYTRSFGIGASDVYLIKTDSQGDTIWTSTFGGVGHFYDYGYSVEETTDGGYIVAGEKYSSGNSDVYLIKTDSYGNGVWTRTFGGLGADRGYSVKQTIDGGYIVTGNTNSYGNGSWDAYLIKTDVNGDSTWTKTFGGISYDYSHDVQQTIDGGYVVVGSTYSFGNGGYDVYLIKTDVNGNTYPILGCIDTVACNYDINANTDDGSCLLIYGCTDPLACNYDGLASCDDGSCLLFFGCTDPLACNYDSLAVCDDGSCSSLYGCTNPQACNYDSLAVCDDGSCSSLSGCTDSLACNYNSFASCDNGSCFFSVIWQQSLSLCDGQSINIGSNIYDSAGNYIDTLVASNGCDSILYSNISVFPSAGWQQSFLLCSGDNITVGSHVYSSPGNYIDTLSALNGCDSIVYTNISVAPLTVWQQAVSICDGDSVLVGNSTYQSAGYYIDTLSYPNICDTIMYTNIQLDYNTYSYDTVVISSGGYYWLNNLITISGNYSDTLVNLSGCDSILHLNLTIMNTTSVINLNDIRRMSRITNVLGQETPLRNNAILLYIYEDGTVEKRVFIE